MSKNMFNEMTNEKKRKKETKEGNRLIVHRHGIYQSVCTPHGKKKRNILDVTCNCIDWPQKQFAWTIYVRDLPVLHPTCDKCKGLVRKGDGVNRTSSVLIWLLLGLCRDGYLSVARRSACNFVTIYFSYFVVFSGQTSFWTLLWRGLLIRSLQL